MASASPISVWEAHYLDLCAKWFVKHHVDREPITSLAAKFATTYPPEHPVRVWCQGATDVLIVTEGMRYIKRLLDEGERKGW